MEQRYNIKHIEVSTLNAYANNARTHSEKQIHQIAKSIETFGFNNPVLIDKNNTIIAGHGRVEAAKKLGLTQLPTLCLEHLTNEQKKAYILADNRLAEKAGWDDDILRIELQNLLEVDLDFDISFTGFEMPEIDLLIQETVPESKEEDVVPEAPSSPISKLGDLWILGQHRLHCGDALEKKSYSTLLGEEKANLVFTDPPYNVKIDGHVCGNGKVQHREFAMASGEMTPEGFTSFLQTVFQRMTEHTSNGSIHFICMDWRHMKELLTAGNEVYTELKNLCVWNKDNGGMGSLYRSKHELVFVFKNGKESHTNNIELGKYGRYRTNVWDYAGINTLRNGRDDELAMHPTVKPVSMVADAILDCSNRSDIILDPFGGSGSTMIAAEKTGRSAYLLELDPIYVDVIINRWQNLTGEEAIHAQTKKTFKEVQHEQG